MYIFVSEGWADNPKREEDYKKPEMTDFQWYPINALPYSEMSAGDTLWLPQVLEGLYVTGFVYFGDTIDEVLDKYLVFSEHPAELPPLHL